MPSAITIRIDTKAARAGLDAIARSQFPFAQAQALNAVAFNVMRAERLNIASVLEHPRPFTANSVMVGKRATRALPRVTVFVRPEVSRYLEPYEFGGLHVLPGQALLVPVNVRLDQYGQLPKNTMQRLLARPDVFVGRVRGIMGVWQRIPEETERQKRRRIRGLLNAGLTAAEIAGGVKHKLKLLIRFGDDLPVQKHLNFERRANEVAAATWSREFDAAMTKALASAR